MCTHVAIFSPVFAHTRYFFARAPFAQTLAEVDRGRSSGHGRGGLGSIRAVFRAWRALKVYFSAEVITTAPCREHAYPQLTTKLQPSHQAAGAGSIMSVRQVRAVAFIGACNRSPDHANTSAAAAAAACVCCVILLPFAYFCDAHR